MYTRKLLFALALLAAAPATMGGDGPGLGQPLDESDIPGYARHVMPDGAGLPPGGGTAVAGEPIYAAQCGASHGATGTEGPIQPVVGPVQTYPKAAGRHWPYATTLFDYIRRAMPFHTPKSLSDDEVYAVTAYILYRNELIGRDEVVNASNLANVEMPNRGNFVDVWGK